ncbi:hypothetical protein GCM10027440_48190 [Nocardiopsis coralliicola]
MHQDTARDERHPPNTPRAYRVDNYPAARRPGTPLAAFSSPEKEEPRPGSSAGRATGVPGGTLAAEAAPERPRDGWRR